MQDPENFQNVSKELEEMSRKMIDPNYHPTSDGGLKSQVLGAYIAQADAEAHFHLSSKLLELQTSLVSESKKQSRWIVSLSIATVVRQLQQLV